MPIGSSGRRGGIGGPSRAGRIGVGGKHPAGDALGPGVQHADYKSRSAYWLQYPATTTTTSSTYSTTSSSSSTTTTTTAP